MTLLRSIALILCVLVLPQSPNALEVPYVFEDPSRQEKFNALLEELRCLVCQNQSLADSGAGLAQDLRAEVYKMVLNDESNDTIKNFMVERYGNFVLYNPPLTKATALLWFGPLLLFSIAVVVVVYMAKKNYLRKMRNADTEN